MLNIEKIICINLPEDKERKQHIANQFAKISSEQNIEWISAERPSEQYRSNNYNISGEFGCALSHLKAYIHSIDIDGHVLIIEDDATFYDVDVAADKLNNVLDNLPYTWDLIYLGGAPRTKLTKLNDNLCQVGDFRQTVGYILNHESKKKLAMYVTDNISKPYPWATADGMLITFLSNPLNKGYCFYPPLIYQKQGYSPLRNEYRDYTNETDNFWKINKPE